MGRRLRRCFELHLRSVRGLIQSAQNTVMNAVKYILFIEEFHFRLGRVYIHIYQMGREIQMQNTGGEFAHHDLIAVGFFQSGH